MYKVTTKAHVGEAKNKVSAPRTVVLHKNRIVVGSDREDVLYKRVNKVRTKSFRKAKDDRFDIVGSPDRFADGRK